MVNLALPVLLWTFVLLLFLLLLPHPQGLQQLAAAAALQNPGINKLPALRSQT